MAHAMWGESQIQGDQMSHNAPMKRKALRALIDTIPSDVLELLGQPPVLPTEDANLYYAILAHFARSIRPGEDLITWMLIKDLADHRVEIARFRRIKADLVAAARRREIRSEISKWKSSAVNKVRSLKEGANGQIQCLTNSRRPPEEIAILKSQIEEKLASDIAACETKTQTQVEIWGSLGTSESDYVDSFKSWIGDVARIDALLEVAEQRCSATLEEIDRHLNGLGRFLREDLDKIIEGSLAEQEPADGELSEKPQVTNEVTNNASGEVHPHIGPTTIPARRSIDVRRSDSQSTPGSKNKNERVRRRPQQAS
jgi:hypothetical protein